MLLVIYALFNMNDVSWGTREVPKSQADLAAEAENQVRQVFLLLAPSGALVVIMVNVKVKGPIYIGKLLTFCVE